MNADLDDKGEDHRPLILMTRLTSNKKVDEQQRAAFISPLSDKMGSLQASGHLPLFHYGVSITIVYFIKKRCISLAPYTVLLASTMAFVACGSDNNTDADANQGLDASSTSACENNPCAVTDSGATCSVSDSESTGYVCECSTGYSSDGESCVDSDACENNLCATTDSAATCVDDDAPSDGYSCECSDNFSLEGNTCVPKPCALPPDVDNDGSAAYPFGNDLDDDGDGARSYLFGGRDTNDSNANVVVASGNGSFTLSATYPLNRGGSPTGVVTGDFNDDGNMDVAITDQSGSEAGEGGHAEVWLGGGDLSFSFASNASLTRGGGQLSTGDFNGDGALDLFNKGEVLLGNCDGTFTASATLQPQLHSSYVADLNGDNNMDVVGIVYGSSITRLMGAGDGSFTEGSLAYPNVQALAIGFLDDNTSMDVVADAYGTPYTLKTFTQDAMGALTQQSLHNAGDFNTNPIIGDVNNDGNNDVISYDFIANTVNVFLGDGTGALAAPIAVMSGIGSNDGRVLIDVDGDGNRDLLITDQINGFAASAGNGNTGFAAPTFVTTGQGAFGLATADFNADGKIDAVVVNISSGDFVILEGQ